MLVGIYRKHTAFTLPHLSFAVSICASSDSHNDQDFELPSAEKMTECMDCSMAPHESATAALPTSSGQQLVSTEHLQHFDRWKFLHHAHLGPREIRLFRLIGYSEDPPKRVEWEWIHVSLDDLPAPYKAFSYTWGDPTLCSMMFLPDDHIVAITRSVDSILRYVVEEEMREYFWIDAICICQTNVDEKSSQVLLMGEIYASALMVIVSLGSPSEDSDAAMLFVPALFDAFEKLEAHETPITSKIFTEPAEEARLCLWPSEKWIALHNLLQRAWFQRVWVVQEVVIGANAVLVCGSRSIEWTKFATTISKILAGGLSYFLSLQSRGIPGSMASVNRIETLRQVRGLRLPVSLRSLLLEFISYHSTNPRDKIYALLALVTDGSSSAIEPDYNMSTLDLFTHVTRHLMDRGGSSLALLHSAGIGYPPLIPDLPSWVPDFSLTRGGGYICNFFTNSGYKASGDTCPDLRQYSNSTRLSLKGILVDKIMTVSSMHKPPQTHFQWINCIADMIGSLPPNTNGQSNHEVFWRTIVANRTHKLEPATPEYANHLESYKAMMQMNAHERVSSESDMEARRKTLEKSSLFQMALNVNLSGRQAFITHGGRAGLTFPGAVEGDLVCILLGAMTPFVLREDGTDGKERRIYRLVGESYVHGLMEGEGLRVGKVQDIILI